MSPRRPWKPWLRMASPPRILERQEGDLLIAGKETHIAAMAAEAKKVRKEAEVLT